MIALLLLLQDEIITEERARAVLDEMIPRIEKATGLAFDKRPEVSFTEPGRLAEILEAEILPQVRVQLPEAGEEALQRTARQSARLYTAMLLGKFGFADKKIHVIPGNFKRQADGLKNPRIHSADFLRVVLLHELVHALDEQKYGACSRFAELKTSTEIEVWNAVLEGHAQHVTLAVLSATKEEELFRDFQKVMLSAPPGTGETEKFLIDSALQSMRFAYFDGQAFFDALAKERKTYVEDVFRNPPRTKAVVLRPETYYNPEAEVRLDLKPVWEEMRKEREGWPSVVREMDGSMLRTGFGPFAKAEDVDRVVKAFRTGEAFVQQTRAGDRMVMVAVYSMRESSEPMYDLLLAVSKTKDEKMKEGQLRITKSEYGELKTSKPRRHVVASKTLVYGGQELSIRYALFETGTAAVELVFTNEPVEDAALVKEIERICGRLK